MKRIKFSLFPVLSSLSELSMNGSVDELPMNNGVEKVDEPEIRPRKQNSVGFVKIFFHYYPDLR